MTDLSVSMADAVVLFILVATVALILRGMLRGSIKTCDSASCGGMCAGCSKACGTHRLTLSPEQQEQLSMLTMQAKEQQ